MNVNPLNAIERQPASCRFYIDDDEAPEYYPMLRELVIETARTEAWSATLRFGIRRNEFGQWDILDDGRIKTWASIRIDVLFGEQNPQTLLKGYLREHRLEMPDNAGEAELIVECQDQSLRLDREHQRRSWGEQAPTSDQTIFMDILSSYGLRLMQGSDTGQTGLVELPQDESDIEFLRKRAEANQYELIFYPDEVYFGPSRVEPDGSQPTILVYAGQASNCLGLTISADGHLPDAVVFDVPSTENRDTPRRSEPVYSNLPAMGPERADSRHRAIEPHTQALSGAAGNDEEALQRKAQATINRLDLERIKAEGELDGTLYGQVLRPGFTVPVDGLGERTSGIYYVDRVTHRIGPNGYRQAFTLLRNAYGDNVSEASRASPALLALW